MTDEQTLALADQATSAAAFAISASARSLADGVHPEHIVAVLCYLTLPALCQARESMTVALPAVAGRAYAILLRTAAEYQS